ncbi:hypothetical protein [Pseudoxanthomonas sp. LARHCG66]
MNSNPLGLEDMHSSDRSTVIVLGPPRSGTSAVCHVLRDLGIDFGDPKLFVNPEKHAHNPIFFELVELNEINDEILAELGWSYRDFVATPLAGDFSPEIADKFEVRIARFIESNFGSSTEIGLKDPRFCFTLPVWTTILGRLGIRQRHLLTHRDGEAVAVSNFRLSPTRGIDYARRIVDLSMGAALHLLDGRDYQVVRFEGLAKADEASIAALADVSQRSVGLVKEVVASVFDDTLVHGHGDEFHDLALSTGTDYAEVARLIRRFRLPVGETIPHAQASSEVEVVGHLLGITGLFDQRATFEFGKVQLYFRLENESYCEESSIVMPWPSRADTDVIAFELPEDCNAGYIRLDLNDSPGAYAVRQLSIDGQAVAPIRHAIAGSGAVLELQNGSIGLVANHDDPWLEFKLPIPDACKLTVLMQRMSLADLGRRGFDDTQVANLLEGLNRRIAQVEDRIVGFWEDTTSTVADEIRQATVTVQDGLSGIQRKQHDTDTLISAVAADDSAAAERLSSELLRVADAIKEGVIPSVDGLRGDLDRTTRELRSDLLRVEGDMQEQVREHRALTVQGNEALEEIRARNFKKMLQGWFK